MNHSLNTQNLLATYGMLMPGRHGSAGDDYRYGFNGMEGDDEISGEGNSYDFGARMFNPRVGRWSALDPLAAKYPGHSPYNFALNNPIYYIDPDGKDVFPSSQFANNQQLAAAKKVFSKTDVYKSLTSAFSIGPDENLLFHYTEGTHVKGQEIAHSNYGKYDKEKTKSAHFIIVAPLGSHTLNSTNDIVEGEMTYDQTFLAGMMAHELIHVNINRYIAGKIDATTLEANFPGLTDYMERFGESERTDHEYMAANSRGVLVQAMKETDIVQNTPLREDKWYQAAAWNGLTHQDGVETEAWTNYKANASAEEIAYVEEVLTSIEVKGQVKANE